MRDLRDRIGKAICDATSAGKLFPWNTLNDREKETWRGYADAVIVALGLRPERGQRSNPTGPLWGSNNRHTVTRWVTDWKPDDE